MGGLKYPPFPPPSLAFWKSDGLTIPQANRQALIDSLSFSFYLWFHFTITTYSFSFHLYYLSHFTSVFTGRRTVHWILNLIQNLCLAALSPTRHRYFYIYC